MARKSIRLASKSTCGHSSSIFSDDYIYTPISKGRKRVTGQISNSTIIDDDLDCVSERNPQSDSIVISESVDSVMIPKVSQAQKNRLKASKAQKNIPKVSQAQKNLTENVTISKVSREQNVTIPKVSQEQINSTEDAGELQHEIMSDHNYSNINNDLCEKLKSNFKIMKVTKRGVNEKFKKCDSAKPKLTAKVVKSKVKTSKDVTGAKIRLNNSRKKCSKGQTMDNLIQSDSEIGESSQSVINAVGEIESEKDETPEISFSSPQLNSKEISDLLNNVIRSYVKIKIEEPESEVYELLSENCNEKLRNVIKLAVSQKERCGRDTLTIGDFNKGILFCDEESLPVPQNKKKEKMLDLYTFLIKKRTDEMRNESSIPKPRFKEMWLHYSPIFNDMAALPKELNVYFKVVTDSLKNRDESCTLALEDLKTNKNILRLVPFFSEFISSEIEEIEASLDFPRLSVTLKAIQSLLLNPFLHFGHNIHLDTFAYLLLKCLINPMQCFNLFCDYRLLKDIAAGLLAHILKRSKSRKLWFEILFALEATFCNKKKSFVAHYGALVAINSFGVTAICVGLLPHIYGYLQHLISAEFTDYETMCDASTIKGELRRSHYLLTSYFMKYTIGKQSNYCDTSDYCGLVLKRKVSKAYLKPFSEYFDDALVQHFPLLSFVSCNRTGRTKPLPNNRKSIVRSTLNSWVQQKVGMRGGNKPDSRVRDLVFDCVSFKKPTIKFGKIYSK